jgi:Tfp pilus assembly protein PilX
LEGKEKRFTVSRKEMVMNHMLRGRKNDRTKSSRGVALITVLLLLIMLSALSVAFVMAVNTENRMQGSDKGSTLAYYGAEAGMEKMMADLNGLYLTTANPTVTQIQNVGSPGGGCGPNCPPLTGITYTEYVDNPTPGNDPRYPQSYNTTVASGPNQGLIASVIPMTMAVTAQTTATQEEVRMIRSVEVALIPVFQFGVFSQSDLDFFAGPSLNISGRVQTNGDLYLAAGSPGPTTFEDKVLTAKEVVRDTLANGIGIAGNHTGVVQLPTASGGCSGALPACRALGFSGPDEGSWQNGNWPNTTAPCQTNPAGNVYSGWLTLSNQTYGKFIQSCENGVVPLKLPFVQPGVSNIEILRRTRASDTPIITDSRLYAKAQIRVLIDDDPAMLPGGLADPDNVRLANVASSAGGPDYSQGVPVTSIGSPVGLAGCAGAPAHPQCNTYFAEGLKIAGSNLPAAPGNVVDPSWITPIPDTGLANGVALNGALGTYPRPPAVLPAFTAPLMQVPTTGPTNFTLPAGDTATRWNLLDGWLRVEVRKADGTYMPVTHEWLQLGFARDFSPPTTAGGNKVHPNAILILQQLANRGALTGGTIPVNPPTPWPALPAQVYANPTANMPPWVGQANVPLTPTPPAVTIAPATPNTGINFYPINIYDTREGEPRELSQGTAGAGNGGNFGCTVNGVINLSEIDVGNLQRWLSGTIGANGTQVENQSQNGYILYFSDHRGMIPQNLAPVSPGTFAILGAYGFEDVINSNNQGSPNSTGDAGEDVESPGDAGFGLLEVYGSNNLGLGFGYNTAAGFVMSDLAPASIRGSAPTHADEVYTRLKKCDIGRVNWVSGARHGVRLVDGTAGNLPLRASFDPNNVGGFTLGTDNPAYVLGDYNAAAVDWNAGANYWNNYPHASSAVLADTVSLLSNNWNDLRSFASPGKVFANAGTSGRPAQTTYFRLAISSGKNVDFQDPNCAGGGNPAGTNGGATMPGDLDTTGVVRTCQSDFGTDGGVHNFLRYLEDWGPDTSYYTGSMVSLYYSEYETGVFKCCDTVYHPPTRKYKFDLDFQNIGLMPPGTPRFQEVINIGYKQDLTYR